MIEQDLYVATMLRWWQTPKTPRDWRQISQWFHGAAMICEEFEQCNELLTLSQVASYREAIELENEVPTFLRRQAE